ncbi:Os01g0893550 [Oryza sativa Japonica Group]|nr:Os01g0893550 [Oryza sativa Japonica Group]
MAHVDGRVVVGGHPPVQRGGGAPPAAAGYPLPKEPPRRRRRRPSTFASCRIFATAFLVVIGLLWITEFFLIMFYDTYPSPTNVLLFLPITLLVIAACFACGLAMVVCCDHGEHEGNRRVQNSPV